MSPSLLLRFVATWGRSWRIARRGGRIGRAAVIESGVDIGTGPFIGGKTELVTGGECHFAKGVIIHTYGGCVQLGDNVYVGPYTVIYGHGGVSIGDHTLISMHCRILSSNHTVPPMGTPIRSQPDTTRPTRIGTDVWLGAGVTVLGGVSIGDGCVVGAGAVVAHDLPSGTVAVGVPARATGTRASLT